LGKRSIEEICNLARVDKNKKIAGLSRALIYEL